MNLPKWMLKSITQTKAAALPEFKSTEAAEPSRQKSALTRGAVYLYRRPVDFRNSMIGLARILSKECPATFFAGAGFVFTNRSRDSVKVLYRDDNGFCVLHKRLDEGCFAWPSTIESGVRKLADSELEQLLAGVELPFEQQERIAA